MSLNPNDNVFTFPTDGGQLFCGHCLQLTAALKKDKRGRPFLWCPACRSRSFIYSDMGLTGVRVMSPEAVRLFALALNQSAPAAPQAAPADGKEAVG